MEEVKIDKRTKDYSLKVNNPGFHLCTVCGGELPPNEDGSQKYRRCGEACYDCVMKNYGKAIINGKEVDIDPSKPPQPNFHTDGRVTYETGDS